MDPIIANLDDLANLQDKLAAIELRFQERRNEILKPVQEALELLEADLEFDTANIHFSIGVLEQAIKEQVIDLGKSVKGAAIHAVYSKPRVTWDSKGLDGFMVAHPEIGAFRKTGQPSVSFRKIAK